MFPRLSHGTACSLILALSTAAAACGSGLQPGPTPAPETSPPPPPSAIEPPARTRERLREDLVVREIQPGAWVVTHERPLAANSLVVRAADGSVLLADTPWTPDATRALLDWIDARLEPTSIRAVNSHYHLDALGGNAALRDARVGTQGLVTTAELVRERGEALRRGLVAMLDDPREKTVFEEMEILSPPSLYMAARYRQPLGPETYELIFPGAGHSPDNLVVWLPERKLLFGGCMVKGGSSLGYLGDADLESWPHAIRRLQALGAEIVVPGHGDRLDAGQLQHTLDLLAAATLEAEPTR